uniref:Carboxylic ester hydrolase n=1 Tax=Rhodnius prolixus TaxID=13249 RepID=T1HHP2_RHOPR
MFGDRRNSAVPTALKLHKGPHYLYYFDYEVEHSYQEILFGKKVLRGAAHLDDATLIWRYKNPIAIPPSTTSSDLNVSHILLKLIVNFVYSGNPTPDGSDFSWPRWDKQQQNFISFENKGITHNKGSELIVNTTQGQLRGREFKSRNGRKVAAFSGIPFAKPPLGQLRFQLKPSKLLPVIFYISGGGFNFGSGEIDKTPEYFMDYDVVVVMHNYRLGPFGFISMEDDILAGNMGMKDQVMALEWVRKNIANFGGDPEQVTLIGESAGGASVSYHMYSPMSRGLFHRAISQAGTALSCWATIPPGVARSQAIYLAKKFNCSVDSSQMILDCLRTINAYELIESSTQYISGDESSYFLEPIIDTNSTNPFIPFDPQTSEPAPLPWIVGVDSVDGATQTDKFYRNFSALADLNENFEERLPGLLQYKETSLNPDEITKKIKEYYFDDQQITLDLFKNLTDVCTLY